MRRRRSLIFALLMLFATGLIILGVVGFLLKQTPQFYVDAGKELADDPLVASSVLTRLGDLQNDIRSRPQWSATFTAAELNAFLREQLSEGKFAGSMFEGVQSPRIAIDGDRITLATRVKIDDSDTFSTIVSLELRVWLVNKELNTVAVELLSAKAGALPIGWLVQSKLDQFTETAHDSWNADVRWYRKDGNPVGVIRFYADQPRPLTQFSTVRTVDDRFIFVGKTDVR